MDTEIEEKQQLIDSANSSTISPIPESKEVLPQWTKSDQPATATLRRNQLLNAQAILLNFFSTVAIVFMNKTVFSNDQLGRCQIFIAAWHFTCTFLVLHVASRSPFNAFKAVRLPLKQMLPISVFFVGFLVLGNLSLAFNTVGFYQLAKVLTTPCVVLLNFLLFRVSVSRGTLLTIACVCVGVSLTNSQAARSNWLGALIAAQAFTVTALYQIWIGKKIVELDVSASQLLLNQAPVSVGILLVMMPFIDTIPDFSKIPSNVLWTLFGSGILASLLNLSQFLIIGRTSALTFNIVSNLKTIMIVSLSWYQEGKVMRLQDIFGVVLALGGAYAYSQLSQKR